MNSCRICKSKIKLIYNFGKIALVGEFLKTKTHHKRYKISLNYCVKCKHVQIAEKINPNILFKNYLWETGVSKSNMSLINQLIMVLKNFKIHKGSKILEIASNDGSFIKQLKKKYKCSVIGVDPAKNLAKIANKNKIRTLNHFFNYKFSNFIRKKFNKFDFIFARNVIAHVKNPNEIFQGVENLLHGTGVFILEVPHLLNIIKDNQYDNIFHEHIGFHSLKSINDLCKNNNLKLFNVERINSQGGSIRCYISKNNFYYNISNKIEKLINLEKNYNLFNSKNLENFKFKIKNHSKNFFKLILNLKRKKNNISIYGASGKGQALIQFSRLNNKLIDFVFDKSKLKQGCYTPGSNIKILDPKYIQEKKTKYLIILSWNIKNEIIKQEKKFIKSGGKIILPFPKPKILN